MMVKWLFGYRCEIQYDEAGWYGLIFVPRWHPIRSMDFGDSFIFMHRNEWLVPINECNGFYETLNRCWCSAMELRGLQDIWDKLSPYEREYKVW